MLIHSAKVTWDGTGVGGNRKVVFELVNSNPFEVLRVLSDEYTLDDQDPSSAYWPPLEFKNEATPPPTIITGIVGVRAYDNLLRDPVGDRYTLTLYGVLLRKTT